VKIFFFNLFHIFLEFRCAVGYVASDAGIMGLVYVFIIKELGRVRSHYPICG
jgi:hypothetical protein